MTVKKLLFGELANLAQAMASPQRLELLDYLAQAERSVESLSRLSGLSVANTSKHLQVLKQASLVVVRKKGTQRLYYVASDQVVVLISHLRKVAESRVDEVNRLIESYITKDERTAPMAHEELLEWMEVGDTLILDIRPEKEYLQGHIKGAINVVPETMKQQLENLSSIDKERLVVTYCRGPYCLFAHEAVHILQEKGLNARRLQAGFPEWKAAGLPICSKRDEEI